MHALAEADPREGNIITDTARQVLATLMPGK
jgi:hypothetical protein